MLKGSPAWGFFFDTYNSRCTEILICDIFKLEM